MVGSVQRKRKAVARGASNDVLMTDLRAEVADKLERLSQILVANSSRTATMAESVPATPAIEEIQKTIRFFGQVVAAWADLPPEALPPQGAGFGSTVVVEDLDQGVRETFTLMAGPLLDIDAGQVSLAAPVGLALLGVKKGDVVSVRTPNRLRRLEVVKVLTLQDRIAQIEFVPRLPIQTHST